MMQAWICSYDISDNTTRKQVAEALLNYGQRIQYSVFELHLQPSLQISLSRKIIQNLQKNDSIRWYQVCKNCQRISIGYGQTDNIKKPDYFLI